MDILPRLASTEFRKTYQHIRQKTIVTVNDHAIGLWTPLDFEVVVSQAEIATGYTADSMDKAVLYERDAWHRKPMTQADRDAILRRVNKGG
jgi:hypothetical protein